MAAVDQDSRFQLAFRLVMVLVLPVLAFGLGPARAVTVEGLYDVEVSAQSEQEADVEAAYRRGLSQVLVRVSGSAGVLEREDSDAVLDEAGSLLESWQQSGGSDGDNQIRMRFGPSAVHQALSALGVPVWGVNRPLTLAWVAVQDRGDRGLLVDTGQSDGEGWSALLEAEADRRGLPLMLPPADRAGDRRLLSEVWGQFMEPVKEASRGIAHDLLAVVRISRSGGAWQAGWTFQGQGIDQQQTVSADTPEVLTARVVDAWTEELASRFASSGGMSDSGPEVNLVVEGVATTSDYAAITKALSGMNPIESVGAVEVGRKRIVFQVTFSGALEQLQRNIALDDRFQAGAAPQDETGQSADDLEDDANSRADGESGGFETGQQKLYYRWRSGIISTPSATD